MAIWNRGSNFIDRHPLLVHVDLDMDASTALQFHPGELALRPLARRAGEAAGDFSLRPGSLADPSL